jgi:hypothetical protein
MYCQVVDVIKTTTFTLQV